MDKAWIKNYFKIPFLLVLCEIPCPYLNPFEFFYNEDNEDNEDFGLDFDLFIIYNFDFIFVNGDFL